MVQCVVMPTSHGHREPTPLHSELTLVHSVQSLLRSAFTHLHSELTHLQSLLTHLHSELTHLQRLLPHPRSELTHLRSLLPHPRSELPHLRSLLTHPRSGLPHLHSGLTYPRSDPSLALLLEKRCSFRDPPTISAGPIGRVVGADPGTTDPDHPCSPRSRVIAPSSTGRSRHTTVDGFRSLTVDC